MRRGWTSSRTREPAGPSFPAAATTSVSEIERAFDGAGVRGVGERCIRRRERNEGDPGGVVRVAVARSGRRRAPDRRSAGRCASRTAQPPPTSCCQPATRIRQHRRARRYAGEPPAARRRPRGRPAISVPCRSSLVASSGFGRRKGAEVAVAEDVDSVLNAATQERLRAVDARVEQRDRDPRPSNPGSMISGS